MFDSLFTSIKKGNIVHFTFNTDVTIWNLGKLSIMNAFELKCFY